MNYIDKLAELQNEATPSKEGFEKIRRRILFLTRETDDSIIERMLKDIKSFNSIQQEKLLSLVKEKTGISLNAIKSFSYDDEERPDHVALARQVISGIGPNNIICTEKGLFLWEGTGVWKIQREREIKKIVQKQLNEMGCFTSSGLVNNVTEVLKTETYQQSHEWNRRNDIINFQNGELHLIDGEWRLKEHNQEHFLTSQIPHNYDETAKAPRFEQFLYEVFLPDADGNEKSLLIKELIGYTFMPHTKYEKFALLVGKGANGKSVLLSLLYSILGPKNVVAVQPSQFGNTFQRAHLHLKLANLVTEMAEGCEIADAELKAIVSGEITTVESKYQDPVEIIPYATCWFGSNHLPHTRDFSEALFRRALVIHFNRKFTEGIDADPNLNNKLIPEIPGIINLALNAYKDVVQRNAFSEPESCKKAKHEWRLEADQVAQFINEACTPDKSARTASKDLYAEYQSWALRMGITRKVTHKSFSIRLDKLGYELSKGTGGMRMISGVRLRNTLDDALECLS